MWRMKEPSRIWIAFSRLHEKLLMIMEPGRIQAETTLDDFATQPASHPVQYQPRRGLSIPAITVLDARGRVIEDDQRAVFRYLAQQGRGADILFGVGTTGEWNRISNEERQRLIWIETDEVARINHEVLEQEIQQVEAWVGVTAATQTETLAKDRKSTRLNSSHNKISYAVSNDTAYEILL